jgi:uncharacterized protein
MTKPKIEELEFSEQRIFDNIHGFIQLTDFEWQLVDSPLFQRLRNIRQLGLLDYVFPGALHNRFNHSLGVMHIADRMVVSLQEKNQLNHKRAREIVRVSALLHDIGHYPWSHIIEVAVMKDAKKRVPRESGQVTLKLPESSDNIVPDRRLYSSKSHKKNLSLYTQRNYASDFAHHERMAGIILFESSLHKILKTKFSKDEITKIAQIISGDYPGAEKFIIHSELDADRFDYLLRDSKQTGVPYGIFDLDQIIRHIDLYSEKPQKEGLSPLVVHKKGQKAVEHYLLSRYFLYNTVIYQKTITGFHYMAEKIYSGLLERGAVRSYGDIVTMFDKGNENEYLEYDDSYMFEKLKKFQSNPKSIKHIEKPAVSSLFLKDLIRKVLYRDPLKRVVEIQMLLDEKERKEENKPHKLIQYFQPATIEYIVKRAKIPKEWYITSPIKNSITSLSPSKIPKDGDFDDKFIERKIKILNEDKIPVSLTDDPSSLFKFLQKTELHIYGIYTKNDEYKNKIDAAMKEYERILATTDQ